MGNFSLWAKRVDEIKQAFRDSVDDYLGFCVVPKQAPEKPFNGKFMLRLPPDLHRRVDLSAKQITVSIICKGCHSFSQRTGNRKIYIRMLIGGIFEGVFSFSVSYLWAWLNNNINPVSGLGMMVTGAFGIVVGALIGAINIQKNNSKMRKIKEQQTNIEDQ